MNETQRLVVEKFLEIHRRHHISLLTCEEFIVCGLDDYPDENLWNPAQRDD